MPLGNSVTQADQNHNSYRRPLWRKLQAGGYPVDFVGSQSSNFNGPPPNPDFDLNHEGHWGWRVDELLVFARNWAAAAQPNVVLVHAGSNDMLQNQSINGTRDELGQLIDQLRLGQPSIKILLAQLIPTAITSANSNITALNALLPTLAQQKTTTQSPVIIVDQNTGFDANTDTYDRVHPTATGEEKMATRWYAALQTILSAPPAANYTLGVTTNGNGTVNSSPTQATYATGTTVTLTAVPDTGNQFAGWSGDASGTTNPLTLSMTANRNIIATFTATASPPQITSYTLVNADTNLDLQTLTSGTTLNLPSLPTRNLNIRADPSTSQVMSVVFNLTGPQTRLATESTRPFALFSDINGDYFPWTPSVGTYSLTVTPFDATGGSGNAGNPLIITFSVVNNPLPVELTAFTAEANGPANINLHWATATEVRNEKFIVERSLNGHIFTGIATIPGHLTTSTPKAYHHVDRQLPAMAVTLYYRLCQVDIDGKTSFSMVRTVSLKADLPIFQVFALLPLKTQVQYQYSGSVNHTTWLELYNALGQRQAIYPISVAGAGAISVAGLPSGSYFLRLISTSGSYAGRFVIP